MVLTVEQALAEDAPKLHENGNIVSHQHMVRGNVEQALADAAFVVH